MRGPIPVFEFVFAAYAATRTRRPSRALGEPPAFRQGGAQAIDIVSRGDLFAPRASLVAFLAELGVKVRVVDCGASGRPQALEPGDPQVGPVEDLWLGEIVETRLGFTGVVRVRPERLPNVQAGDSIAFAPTDILEWKHFDAADGGGPPAQHPTPEASGLALP